MAGQLFLTTHSCNTTMKWLSSNITQKEDLIIAIVKQAHRQTKESKFVATNTGLIAFSSLPESTAREQARSKGFRLYAKPQLRL